MSTVYWRARDRRFIVATGLLEQIGKPRFLIVERYGESDLLFFQEGDQRATASHLSKVLYKKGRPTRIALDALTEKDLELPEKRNRRWYAFSDGEAIRAVREVGPVIDEETNLK